MVNGSLTGSLVLSIVSPLQVYGHMNALIPPHLALFLKASYQSIRNATIALEHRAVFQPLQDYLMKLLLLSFGQKSKLRRENNVFFSLCMVYLFHKINIHIDILVCLKSKVGQ